ncbi:MAG TPA: ComF family protein [Bacteroidota bacterium]|nr:ComF family protein [Bacteroidota bacterium]
MNLFQQIGTPLLDLLCPPVCFLCDGEVRSGEEKICEKCWNGFRTIDSSHPVWNELGRKLEDGGAVDGFTSCYLFETNGSFQNAIHLLKYQGIKTIGKQVGREIGKRIAADENLRGADYVVAVPLHKSKERDRGYNQAEFLCRGIHEETGISILSGTLHRTRFTESQTKLNLEERRLNVAGAFSVRSGSESTINDKSFILVDDVMTTGSTLTACARVLKSHGARRVFAASAALAE